MPALDQEPASASASAGHLKKATDWPRAGVRADPYVAVGCREVAGKRPHTAVVASSPPRPPVPQPVLNARTGRFPNHVRR